MNFQYTVTILLLYPAHNIFIAYLKLCFCILILLFSSHHIYANADIHRNVSQFGQQVLSSCALVVRGTPEKIWQLHHGGGHFASFQVKEIYQGQIALGQTIQIFSLSMAQFTQQEQWVVFLQPMTTQHTFSLVGYFSTKEQSSPAKVKMLQKLIMLEMIPNMEQRKYAYLEYCLSGLADSQEWPRSHALQEWRYLIKHYPHLLKKEHLVRLREICEKIPEFAIRQSLQKDLVWLQKKISLPASSQSNAAFLRFSHLLARAQIDIHHSDFAIQMQALHTLGTIVCPSSRLMLEQCLQDRNPQIRATAVFYLGKQANPASIPAIRSMLAYEKHLGVCKYAIQALGEMRADQAIGEILPYLQISYTKDTARRAIERLKQEIPSISRP